MTVYASKPEINVREKLNELDKPSGIAGEAMLRADTPQEQQALIGVGRRNMIINGAMMINQRNTTITANGYSLDRWKVAKSSGFGAFSATSSSGHAEETGHDYALKVDCTTSDTMGSTDYLEVYTRLEGYDCQKLKFGSNDAEFVTVSFWVKSNRTGIYSMSLYTYSSGRRFNASYTIDNPSVWEKKTITIPPLYTHDIVNGSGTGLQLEFWLALGPTYTTSISYWNTTDYGIDGQVNFMDNTNNEWEITGVQMEPGKTATPFEHRTYGEELALCQRYYYTHAHGDDYNVTGNQWSTTQCDGRMNFPVPMRATPSITFPRVDVYLESGAGGSGWSTSVTAGVNRSSKFGTGIRCNHSGNVGTAVQVQFGITADADL